MLFRSLACSAMFLAAVNSSSYVHGGDKKNYDRGPPKIVESNGRIASDNFVFFTSNGGDPKLARDVLSRAEVYRTKAYELWAPNHKPAAWSCNVMLSNGPIRLPDGIGVTGSFTQEPDPGKTYITCRTVHLDVSARIGRDFKIHELPHEVTHAVIGDIFFPDKPPRWADEGMAMLSEDDGGALQLKGLLKRTADKKRALTAVKVLDLREYPVASQRGEFYELGLAVTKYLVEKKDRKTFVQFLRSSNSDGSIAALQKVYGFKTATAFNEEFEAFLAKQK